MKAIPSKYIVNHTGTVYYVAIQATGQKVSETVDFFKRPWTDIEQLFRTCEAMNSEGFEIEV